MSVSASAFTGISGSSSHAFQQNTNSIVGNGDGDDVGVDDDNDEQYQIESIDSDDEDFL